MEIADIVKVMLPGATAFTVGIIITPLVTHFLYKHRVWKEAGTEGKDALDGSAASEFNKLHADRERHVPRMGGIVIWGSALITVLFVTLLAKFVPTATTVKLDFLSRDQTWIPFLTLIIGAMVGFFNDLLDVRGGGRGLSLKRRLAFVIAMSGIIGWWFYDKLDVTAVGVPFDGALHIGVLVIPLFVLMTLALYASGVIDGIDGLSGGVFASVFAAYAVVAFYQQQINLAAFCAMLVGAILAFLWFNVPPARFFMTETGTMALTLTLSVVAFMTDAMGGGIGISALPLIGFLLVATVASDVIQVVSKKYRGKKVFRVAPLHHHFEAVGWPGYKVTMRYWILSIMFAFVGVIFALVG
jgi:phospho-N-acetylmuramoyl-pentapeptide-transferase